jgi:(2R)-3-sulfolactate dehydrogenase (NADP+)
MTGDVRLTISEVEDLAIAALSASKTFEANARRVAWGVARAELDGIKSHGLAYVPVYCEHALCGKIDGFAEPSVAALSASAFVADARDGFAHPAIAKGFDSLVPAAREQAVAALAVRNSYNCGVLGHHVERLAAQGLVGIGFTNAPASIAPFGGTKAVVGTNPFACATPDGSGGASILIDQSSSVIAKSELGVRARAAEPIPEGWAFDSQGNPTTDPNVGLKGTMAPSGGYKGVGQAILVEIMAAAMTGATLGIDASSFATNEGGSPRTGQFFLALDPDAFSGGAFQDRIGGLIEAIAAQEGARVPGSKRRAAREGIARDGVTVPRALYDRIQGYCGRA